MGLLAGGVSGSGLLPAAANEMAQACPDTLTVQRAAVTTGSMGGVKLDWSSPTVVASGIPCNVQSASPREVDNFQRQGLRVSHKIFITQKADVRQGDRMYTAGDPATFYRAQFPSDMAGMHSVYRIYAELVV